LADAETKRRALERAAALIRARAEEITAANERDMAFAREKGLTDALLDRLELTPERLEGIAAGVEATAALPDPVGAVLESWER
ncbi:gamma-glutamyl-phosphate reductase, partial [Bacillus sp. SIMBA_161]